MIPDAPPISPVVVGKQGKSKGSKSSSSGKKKSKRKSKRDEPPPAAPVLVQGEADNNLLIDFDGTDPAQIAARALAEERIRAVRQAQQEAQVNQHGRGLGSPPLRSSANDLIREIEALRLEVGAVRRGSCVLPCRVLLILTVTFTL